MAITVQGELGEQLVGLQQEVAAARRRVRDADQGFQNAKSETIALDARLARLEGQEMAGHSVEKEIKSTAKALKDARERSSDDAQREIVVLRAAVEAHEKKVTAFIVANADEMQAALREEGEQIVAAVEQHVTTAIGLRDAYMQVAQSFAELLPLIGRHSSELPPADGAFAYFHALQGAAEHPLRAPIPTELRVAA